MRGALAAAVWIGLVACRGDSGSTAGTGSAAQVARPRPRPAAVVEITLKALGIT